MRAFDTRLEVAEQIESMGGEFLKLDFGGEDGASSDGYAKVMSEEFIKAEMALFAQQAKEVDIIITTALIPGKPAPKLITKEMVDSMKPGSVIVDGLPAATANTRYRVNCMSPTTASMIGYTDLPGRLPAQSSQLYGTNLVNLMKLMCKEKDGNIAIDFEDVVQRNMTVVGRRSDLPAPAISVSAAPETGLPPNPAARRKAKPSNTKFVFGAPRHRRASVGWAMAPPPSSSHFTVFILACVVGYYVCGTSPRPAHAADVGHHAISGIIVVGRPVADWTRVDPGHRWRLSPC